MMEQRKLKTPCQQERENRENALLLEYNELMSVHGQKATAVNTLLMNKYGIHSVSTIYAMLRRAKQRQQEETNNESN